MRRVRRIALYVCTACLHAGLVLGQVTTATLRGRVLDPQGAPVPAASVTVTREDNAISRKATTGADGTFVIANIPPTTVDVVVSATGFSEARRKGIVLEVGGTSALDIELTVGAVQETVNVKSTVASVDITRSVVDAVIPSSAIEALPLNGRNFLELALLVPGNAPAPNFDPTKSNSVLISSAGQLGRGGNITIDGADNNDDVVGGPLQNVTQESVQEFQIATNRFTAESGRSASSVINVVTKSGTDRLQGSASLFARDSAWQSLPATYDRSTGDAPPFDREQLAGSAGGPLAPRTFWFGALEYRNQDGAVLVGVRDVPTRTIRRTFALAPLDDFLGSGRADWRPSDADALMIRYAGEQATDTGASTLDRAIGSASQRQRSRNTYNSIVGTWTRVVGPTFVNAATAVIQRVRQRHRTGRGGAAADLPQHPGRIVLPRSPGHHAETVSDRGHRQPGPRLAQHARRRRVAEGQRAFRPGRLPGRAYRARRGFRHVRPQRRRACGRWGPAVRGDAAKREAGPGAGAAGCQQQLHRAVRAGRLAAPLGSDAERRPSLRAGHGRQEREPCGRDQSDRAAVPPRHPPCRPQQLGTAHRLQLGAW